VTAFVDASALYALIDEDDRHHAAAARAFRELSERRERLVTHDYAVLEATAILQRRIGIPAVRRLDNLLAAIEIAWVGAELAGRARSALLAADRRSLSLVDWTSFLFMRDRAMTTAFTFDSDFDDQGLDRFPA
jgi:predicted nucleic acid-binding protein